MNRNNHNLGCLIFLVIFLDFESLASQDQAKLMCYLMNLIKHQRPDIGKTYLNIKNSFESYYQLLMKEREKVAIKQIKNPKVFTNNSQTIDDVYENLEDYNPTKKKKSVKSI